MSDSTTIRVSRSTQEELKRLAKERGTTVADAVARASRLLRQELMGRDLARPLEDEETEWLEADFG